MALTMCVSGTGQKPEEKDFSHSFYFTRLTSSTSISTRLHPTQSEKLKRPKDWLFFNYFSTQRGVDNFKRSYNFNSSRVTNLINLKCKSFKPIRHPSKIVQFITNNFNYQFPCATFLLFYLLVHYSTYFSWKEVLKIKASKPNNVSFQLYL